MKLIVFGASGGTGRHIVELALEQGHGVTAFVRNPDKLGLSHPNLSLAAGDALDEAAVARAVPGHDAVLCALGAPALSRVQPRADGTRNIVRAMERAGVRRLVCQTSLGIGDSRKVVPLYFKYFLIPLLLRKGFADHERQEAVIRRSGLAWTIVRPPNLDDGPRTGVYWHGFPTRFGEIKSKIARADVADFMLKQLADETYLHRTPCVAYK